MRYKIRKILGDGKTIGAFALIDGRVSVLLLRDYFMELPRFREWKSPDSLETASVDDLEPEVRDAHRSVSVSNKEETDDLTLLPSPLKNCSEETGKIISVHISIKQWLRNGE